MAQSAPAAAVSNIYNTPELRDKIVFTLICLVIYRLGAHITAPGVDVVALTDFFANKGSGGLLGLYDLFVGGGLSHATVFALGIMPYISASIFFQIAGAVIPTVEKMQKDEEGRKKVTQWTRYITVVLAAVQGWGFALFTSSLENAVLNPGFGFKLQTVTVLVTGALGRPAARGRRPQGSLSGSPAWHWRPRERLGGSPRTAAAASTPPARPRP